MFDKKITQADLNQHHDEIENRLSDSARTLGCLVREKTDDLRRELLAKIGNVNLRRVIDERVRELALARAMATPGLSGHDEVLKAARAYEQYLNGEQQPKTEKENHVAI
jgi:hypothetical protein